MKKKVSGAGQQAKGGLARREFLKALAALPALVGALGRRGRAAESASSAGAAARGPAEPGPVGARRVAVLGFDGMDPKLTRQWMAEGHLPNLKQLAEEGCFHELATVNPAATPVAWSSFATGANPGRTRIFDMNRRRPGGYEVVPGDIELQRKRATAEGSDIVNRVMYRVGLGTGLMAAIILFVGRWLVRYLLRDRRVSFLVGSSLAGLLVGVVGGSALLGLVAGLVAGGAVANWLPRTYLEYRNPLGAQTFWELADRAGLRTRILFVPCSFPPPVLEHGRLLSGYPSPDMTTGAYTIYTSAEPPAETGPDVWFFRIHTYPGSPAVESMVMGPPDRVLLEADQLRSLEPIRQCHVPVQFLPDWGKRQVTIRVQGQEETIGERQFSNWFTFTFEMSPLVKEVGIGRFCLVTFTPQEVRLYLMPPNYHPLHLPPNVQFTHPPEFLTELTKNVGFFKTAGWAIDTFRPLIMGQIDDGLFLDDLYSTVRKEWEIVFAEMGKDDWDVLVAVLMASDRAQHLLWHHIDPEHPAYDAEEAAVYGDAILGVYKTLDEWVGLARRTLPRDTTLFIISDHGFAPFRKGVNLNRWLVEEGYLVLSAPSTAGGAAAEQDFWQVTDWSRTRAYAPGLAGVAINLVGREPMGMVEPGAQYRELQEEIRRKLEALTDEETGQRVIRHVYRREEIYAGPYLDEIPDLIVGYERGYRTERSSFAVGERRPIIAPNRTRWSGDHVSVDPPLVPGVLFSNRVLRGESPRLIDLGPTILALLGLPVPSGVDGQALQFGPGKET
jgi:predicted AlkP superfamily phosphohydrolase/phosphomutase